MIDARRRLMTEALGECWHDIQGPRFYKAIDDTPRYICKICGAGFDHVAFNNNRTFASADDYEALRVAVIVPHSNHFSAWVKYKLNKIRKGQCSVGDKIPNEPLEVWLTLSPEECNEIICDFVQSNPQLFPKVIEYLASLVPKEDFNRKYLGEWPDQKTPGGQIASGKRMPWKVKK